MNISIAKRKSIVEESLNVTFNKLTVKKFIGFQVTPRGANVPMVECQCECGRKKTISLWDVRSSKTRTCGIDHPHYEDRSQPAFNGMYRNAYKSRAIKDGLEFSLTEDEFRSLTQQPCHYCGCLPSGIFRRQTGTCISEYINNGVDRKDNNKGYTLDNALPCCAICNHAKCTMSYECFLVWLDRIVAFRK